jgi:glutamate-1-semialdehyde 2,1-aminomutase
MSTRYRKSEEMLARAERVIPLGSQTFSKSKTQYPFGSSPYFISRGQGSRVWDVDGNEYIDFVNGLASINLGYGDPDVDRAVREQLSSGVIFSLPHPLETLVAEQLVHMARAFTGRERVAVCGYHGWQDWYIGSTARHKGVPEAVRALTHTFPYNDLDALGALLSSHSGQFAAVVMEAMNVTTPAPGYLEGVKTLAHRHHALLVFDETITGFRFAAGGAQQHFGVTPDLATFGKAMANGFPLSAVTGRADVMDVMQEIFFSSTFGGEALSLAAALATMKKLEQQPVIETLQKQGRVLMSGLSELVAQNGLESVLSVSGHPAWSFLVLHDTPQYSQWPIRTLFLQEMFDRGILTLGTHNMSYAHGDTEIARILAVYAEVLPFLREAIFEKRLESRLRCAVLEPLFKVR